MDVGLPMGKKREILLDVSRFLPGYNVIMQTFAMGITQQCRSLPIQRQYATLYDLLYYLYNNDIKLVY